MRKMAARVLALCTGAMLCFTPVSSRAEGLPAGPTTSAAGAVLMDVDTTRVLAASNAHQKLPMASTTKVMTALLAVEHGDLDRLVTVPEEAYGIEGSSMYLNNGEKLSLRDLVYGLMLVSGKDAAVTIAKHVGGSVEGFIRMMNSRARELGCANTNFVTPNGLPDPDHYTTAYDLGLISAAAMKNKDFREIVAAQYHQTTTGDIKRTLKNKNKILWQYEGGNGVKTGFTKSAGRCLVFSAQRDGHTIVGVVLNAPDMWNDAISYLDSGFSSYEWKEMVQSGETIQEVQVLHGMKNSFSAVAKRAILLPVAIKEGQQPQLRVQCIQQMEAPVLAGQAVGTLEAWLDGRMLASTPLVAQETVLRKEYPYYVWQLIQQWTA